MKIGNLEVYGIIYLIKNKLNNKIYIGQTTKEGGFNRRYENDLEKHTHNEHLRRSIHKYGIENFDIDKEFDFAYSKEELDKLEDMYIKIYNTTNSKYGYNKMFGGSNGKMTEETKQKMSKNHRFNNGEIMTEETKIKIKKTLKEKEIHKGEDNPMYGITPWNKGIPMPQEMKKHLSEIRKGKRTGKDNPFYNRHGFSNPNSKNIICITTGEIFANAKDAGLYYKIDNSSIAKVCKGKRQTVGGFVFKYISNLTPEEYIKYDIENKLRELELSNKDSSFLL